MGASRFETGRSGDFAHLFVKSGCRRPGTDSSWTNFFSRPRGSSNIFAPGRNRLDRYLQFGGLANELPKYTSNMRQKIADVRGAGKGGVLERVQKTVEEVTSEIHKGDEPAKAKDQRGPVIVQPLESFTFWPVPSAVGPMLERFASAGLVIVLVIFMLIQREDLRNRLIRLVGYGRLTFTTTRWKKRGNA